MKHWITLFLVCAVVVSPIDDARAVGSQSHVDSSKNGSAAGIEPTVYISDGPNHCISIEGSDFWIFIHSPEDNDFTGISLDLDLYGPSVTPPLVTSEFGVLLVSVDVSALPYHFEAIWTSRPLDHEPLINLHFDTDPNLTGFQTPLNVMLTRGVGSTEEGIGMESFAGCCIGCNPCHHGLYVDDYVLVEIGESAVLPFEWDWHCFNHGGSDITVTDTEGWIVSWTPTYAFDWTTCGPCFLPRYSGSIEVFVPDETEVGTTSTVTLAGLNNSRIIILEADDSVHTEATTWGRIKSLYDR